MSSASFRASIIDAFTRTAGHGNRAGVVMEAEGLDEPAMQAAARSIAASETAFRLSPSKNADLRLRYFTPATEIDFCGHATVATFHRLVETGALEAPGRYRLETVAGTVEVELEHDDDHCRVWIATPRFPWEASPIEPQALMGLLGGAPRMLDPELPVRRSGPKLFVPLLRREDLWGLAPRFGDLAREGLVFGIRGVYAFTREAEDPAHVVQGRFFAPAMGVREDPATGAANGPLAEYLALQGVIRLPREGGTQRARAEQGDAMGKPGRLDLEVTGSPERVERARVGGGAVTVLDGTLFLGKS